MNTSYDLSAELGVTAYNLSRSPGETRSAREIFEQLIDDPDWHTIVIVANADQAGMNESAGSIAELKAHVYLNVIAIEKAHSSEGWEKSLKALNGVKNAKLATRHANVDSFNLQACSTLMIVDASDEQYKQILNGAVDTIQRFNPTISRRRTK